MVVRPRSQNPWQLASPRSSVAAGGRGASAVGVDESGALAPAAFRTRRLTLENILGSRSTRQGESAMPHKCLHSSATSSCRICTSPPVLHDRACSTVILAPQLSQAAGISSVCRQAGTIQPIWEHRKPCTSGTVSLIPSRHGGFVPAAAVKKDLLILEPISPSRRACFGGAHTMNPRIKPSGRVHKGHCRSQPRGHQGGQEGSACVLLPPVARRMGQCWRLLAGRTAICSACRR